MARRKTTFEESASMNNLSYLVYVERLIELAISCFKWEGLPDSVDERFFEKALFEDGQAVFYMDKELGDYLCLRCMFGAPLDVYNIPTRRTAYASNGYNYELTIEDSVMIFNNRLHTNTFPTVYWYAKRLWDIDRIIDVNVRAQKTPVLLEGTPEQRLTLKNLYKQYDGNEPFIFGNKNFDFAGTIKAISTGAPYIADRLYGLKMQIWNEALTYLGINNLSVEKKERMFTQEVVSNQGDVYASRFSRLEARRRACDEINKMFGLNLSVNYRDSLDYSNEKEKQLEEQKEQEDGGDEDE